MTHAVTVIHAVTVKSRGYSEVTRSQRSHAVTVHRPTTKADSQTRLPAARPAASSIMAGMSATEAKKRKSGAVAVAVDTFLAKVAVAVENVNLWIGRIFLEIVEVVYPSGLKHVVELQFLMCRYDWLECLVVRAHERHRVWPVRRD